MSHSVRKTAPAVRGGRVQKKNRHTPTPSYWNTPQEDLVVYRERPGHGHRHLLRGTDVLGFARILPEWDELAIGLRAIILAERDYSCDGWYTRGIVAICAWPRQLSVVWYRDYYLEHEPTLRRLGVPTEHVRGNVRCHFEESTVRAFQLLHIFLHELGHHHDAITNRGGRSERGEDYAEQYATKYEAMIWEKYCRPMM